MQRSVHWPTNGSGSSIAVGKIASRTTRKSIWKRFDARTRLFWSSWIKLLLRSLTVCMKKNQKHLTDQLRSLRTSDPNRPIYPALAGGLTNYRLFEAFFTASQSQRARIYSPTL